MLPPLANRKLPPFLVHTGAETSAAYFESLAYGESRTYKRLGHRRVEENTNQNSAEVNLEHEVAKGRLPLQGSSLL